MPSAQSLIPPSASTTIAQTSVAAAAPEQQPQEQRHPGQAQHGQQVGHGEHPPGRHRCRGGRRGTAGRGRLAGHARRVRPAGALTLSPRSFTRPGRPGLRKSASATRRRPIGRSPPRVPSSAQGEDTSSRERRRCRAPATRSIRTVLAAPRNASEQVTHAHDHGGRSVRRARVRGTGQRRAALGDDRALPGHRPRRRGAGRLPRRRHRRRRAGAARRRPRPGRPPAGRRPAHHRGPRDARAPRCGSRCATRRGRWPRWWTARSTPATPGCG